MPVKELTTPYPPIDIDPHFTRVVRYFRPEDYALWGTAAAAGPVALRLWDYIDPSKAKHGIRGAVRLTGFLGVVGGFLLAYQQSSFRFQGLKENEPERERDLAELSALAKAGKPLYGESELSPYLQGVASRNSTFSQFKLQTMPWFNVVNHNNHGVDTSKYEPKP
ncbi:hypothetical protein Q8F55_007192 [Vanrija albida]|uniref:NADH-ubiquinone oxidoreductase 21kDa subunit N-terminal domain-containing protein n=1 Tax=Vanrija albida TaxID=181172 RepID=A0ABR3PZD7_9TREE